MQEPRDGDFVAYIDALQRESAARLARQHVSVAEAGFSSGPAESVPGDRLSRPPQSPAQTAPAGPVRRGRERDARLFKALVAAVIGTASLLSWLGRGGAFSFIVGVVLFAYAVPRLLAVYREQVRAPDSRAAIDHVFGRSGATTTGMKR